MNMGEAGNPETADVSRYNGSACGLFEGKFRR